MEDGHGEGRTARWTDICDDKKGRLFFQHWLCPHPYHTPCIKSLVTLRIMNESCSRRTTPITPTTPYHFAENPPIFRQKLCDSIHTLSQFLILSFVFHLFFFLTLELSPGTPPIFPHHIHPPKRISSNPRNGTRSWGKRGKMVTEHISKVARRPSASAFCC